MAPKKIMVYSVNDVYDYENLSRLRAFVDDQNKIHNPDGHFVTLNGDFLSPSLISAIDKGRNMVEVMNAAKIDHICLGNHDFDHPFFELRDRLEEYEGVCLNSNIRVTDGNDYKTVPYDVSDVDGYKIGWLGFCTTQTADLLTAARGCKQPLEIDEVLEVYKARIDEFKAAHPEIDYLIAITHQFVPEDRIMAKDPHGINLILGGHEHDPYMEEYGGIPIVKVGQDADHVGVVTIEIDENGKTTTSAVKIPLAEYRKDEVVDKAGIKGRNLLNSFDHYVIYENHDGPVILSSCNERIGQCSIGTLFCDQMKKFYHADVGLITGGKLRGKRDYPLGLTLNDVRRTEMPFPDNQAHVIRMTGKDLNEAITYSRVQGHGSGGYLQVDSGITWDNDKKCITTVKGEAFKPDHRYCVVLPFSLLKGMDNNPALVRIGEHLKVKETVHIEDLLLMQEVVAMELVNMKWEQMHKDFMEADANGDNVVSQFEFKSYMEKFGVVGETMKTFFAALDLNEDGVLSPDEFNHNFKGDRPRRLLHEHGHLRKTHRSLMASNDA